MNALRKGYDNCPLPNVPAGEVEELVFDHIRAMIQTPELVARVWSAANDDDNNITARTITAALKRLDPIWDNLLFPGEQARLAQLLVSRVDVGEEGIALQLRATGLQTLVRELVDDEPQWRTA